MSKSLQCWDYFPSKVNFQNDTDYKLSLSYDIVSGDKNIFIPQTHSVPEHQTETILDITRSLPLAEMPIGSTYTLRTTVTIPKSDQGDELKFEIIQKIKSKVCIIPPTVSAFDLSYTAEAPGGSIKHWYSDSNTHSIAFKRGKETFTLSFKNTSTASTDNILYKLTRSSK